MDDHVPGKWVPLRSGPERDALEMFVRITARLSDVCDHFDVAKLAEHGRNWHRTALRMYRSAGHDPDELGLVRCGHGVFCFGTNPEVLGIALHHTDNTFMRLLGAVEDTYCAMPISIQASAQPRIVANAKQIEMLHVLFRLHFGELSRLPPYLSPMWRAHRSKPSGWAKGEDEDRKAASFSDTADADWIDEYAMVLGSEVVARLTRSPIS